MIATTDTTALMGVALADRWLCVLVLIDFDAGEASAELFEVASWTITPGGNGDRPDAVLIDAGGWPHRLNGTLDAWRAETGGAGVALFGRTPAELEARLAGWLGGVRNVRRVEL